MLPPDLFHSGLRGLFALLLALLAACSTVRPWQNQPMLLPERSRAVAEVPEVEDRSLLMFVSMSGGGARAAAFAYGVLDALQQTRLRWQGRDISLIDELDVISGVSGGQHHGGVLRSLWQADFSGV